MQKSYLLLSLFPLMTRAQISAQRVSNTQEAGKSFKK